MKIKVCIANYGDTQLSYLYRIVEEFVSFKRHRLNIAIYTTEKLNIPYKQYSANISYKLYPESIKKALPFACREDMALAIDDYDLFIYDENDMLITENNVNTFLEHSAILPNGQVSGFIRYEINSEGKKVLLDPNPYWGELTNSITQNSFCLNNLHQGSWILLKKDLNTAIQSGGFVYFMHDTPYGILEQGASDPYTQCKLRKIFPRNYSLCNNLLIHHLPNKYCRQFEWVKHGIDLSTLLEFCAKN